MVSEFENAAVFRMNKPAREREAAQGTGMLTHDEPLPQTVYHVETTPAEPFVVRLSLGLVTKAER